MRRYITIQLANKYMTVYTNPRKARVRVRVRTDKHYQRDKKGQLLTIEKRTTREQDGDWSAQMNFMVIGSRHVVDVKTRISLPEA